MCSVSKNKLFFYIKSLLFLTFLISFNSLYVKNLDQSQRTLINPSELTSKLNFYEKDKICYHDIHKPYGVADRDMRYKYIIILILTAFTTILLRFILAKITSILNQYYIKYLNKICFTAFIYLVLLEILFVTYSFGFLDSIQTNLENIFIGLIIFVLIWTIINLILAFSFSNYLSFLKRLDNSTYNFKYFKTHYEKIVNSKFGLVKTVENFNKETINSADYEVNNNLDLIFEQCEYLILKKYFLLPTNPSFKPYLLREDFCFGHYLNLNLIKNLKDFYIFSWTSIGIVLCLTLLWSCIINSISISVSFN
jgi:hypothetical protein